MSLVSALLGAGPSGFGYSSTAEQVATGLDLRGTVVLLTGCNSGIGLESFRVFAARGATVLALARTREKAEGAAAAVVPKGGAARAVPYACELSDPASVRACVDAIRADGHAIDAMVLNAGIMSPAGRTVERGLEIQFLTNHMGHFLLATGLLDQLSPTGRVVSLSSTGHRLTVKGGIAFDDLTLERRYDKWQAYGQSKLANLLFAKALSTRLPAGQVAVAVHPGVISTNLGRNMGGIMQGGFAGVGRLFGKSIAQGAATQVWAAVHPDAAAHSGAYLADCNVSKPSKHGRDAALAARLWEVSEALAARL
jgi:NAD(P)-dependent dehydrogenase (short-subunit alcohol dehydrogenase family)